jgi:arabinofuranan 3-O-arabinosyltransferase
MSEFVAWVRRRQTAISVAMLAALAYLPALTAAPGRMPTDSKLYVYLDPGRFIADTTTTFDARQFAGWVPHQHIAYLWPTGPWYWLFESLGFPDWIAHRLWIGTVLFVAGLGVRWMCRVLGFAPLAALVGALVYQLSPYILPYVSRTSVLLLPFAGLGWIVGCTTLAGQRGRWRYPAAIALIVLTVGAVNATALAMVIPAPVLWLVHATWNRSISWRRAAATAGRVALLSTGVSLWWMAMLVIQGRYGADVLAYSESLESVSFTSTSTEVTRGLGYWLFYVRDAFAATTTASIDHLVSIKVILAGFVLLSVCLAGVVFVRSPHRRFAGLLVSAGVILGVGVHPIDDPSPFMDVLVGDGETGLALALRSSTRAVPVLLIGLAIGAASLVTAAGTRRLFLFDPVEKKQAVARVGVAALVGVLAVVNLPALRTGGFVDPALERDQSPPDHWLAAAEALDEKPDGYRVLQVPGTEFGAFEWGYTVDQPLPGLTERPLVTRDLLPLGSPAAMDLAFALDDRIQEGTLDPRSVAPIARLLGVDTVWVSGDVSFDRFGLARPEVVTDVLTSAPAALGGLSASTSYGEPTAMPGRIPTLDAEALSDPRIGQPIAPVTLVDVDDPVPTVRVKDEVVLLFGSGDGLVDAAAAGVIDGSEAIIYAASDVDGVAPTRLILTDSNRDRAHQWRSSQDVQGYTESADLDDGVLRYEPADQRLPVFGDTPAAPGSQTVSVQRGPVTARASAYGEPFAYRPEDRPVMAIDGDLSTAWLVADRAPAIGEFIELETQELIDHLDLRQPDLVAGSRTISEVAVRLDGVEVARVPLDDRSFVGAGQRIDLDVTRFDQSADMHRVTIEITGTNTPQPPIAEAIGAVGFAEIGTGLEPTIEWIQVPTLTTAESGADVPIDIVFTRLRTEATDPWRSDPEPALRRIFDTGRSIDTNAEIDVTLRFDQRSGGSFLAAVLGESVSDNRHLTGAPTARGASAFDGDRSTSWITPFDAAVGSSVTITASGTATELGITQPEGPYSPITRVRLDDGAGPIEVDVVGSVVPLPRPVDLAALTIEIVSVDEQITIDRRYAEPFVLPAAVAEFTFDYVGLGVEPVQQLAATCRTDLLTVDGAPVGLSFEATLGELLGAAPISATVCGDVEFGSGVHELASTPGALTGFHVDRITITESGRVDPLTEPATAAEPVTDSGIDPTATVLVDSSRRSRSIEVPACPSGCWVIVGEGFNEAWSASAEGRDLGAPTLIDGNANGWWLDATDTPTRVEVEWTAQQPLNIAVLLSALFALACIGLIVWDRRRDDDPAPVVPKLAIAGASISGFDRPVVVGGLAALLGGGLFIGWAWGVAAGVIWVAAAAAHRVRLVGWLGWAIVTGSGLVVTWVVRADRPFPNAGWPVRFEWLHGWTLLGIVLITCAALVPDRDET